MPEEYSALELRRIIEEAFSNDSLALCRASTLSFDKDRSPPNAPDDKSSDIKTDE
jgi:hypothetical protein